MKNLFLVLVLALGFNFNAMSDDGIADLKLLCSDPGHFHNQLPPSEVKINCLDTRFEWVGTTAEEGTFKNSRKICTKAVANKPGISVPRVCTDCPHFPTGYSCPGFKEVCKEVEMTYAVTCDEVMNLESVFKFCFDRLNAEVAATSEQILNVKDTGKTLSVCGIEGFMNGKPVKPTITSPVSQR